MYAKKRFGWHDCALAARGDHKSDGRSGSVIVTPAVRMKRRRDRFSASCLDFFLLIIARLWVRAPLGTRRDSSLVRAPATRVPEEHFLPPSPPRSQTAGRSKALPVSGNSTVVGRGKAGRSGGGLP